MKQCSSAGHLNLLNHMQISKININILLSPSLFQLLTQFYSYYSGSSTPPLESMPQSTSVCTFKA